MNYTSKIVSINKIDSFQTNDGKTMVKYVITFANGHNPHIYAIGEFKGQVGDEVTYDLDQSKNKAKIAKAQQTPYTQTSNTNKVNNYTNKDQLICRQTVIKAAAEYHAGSNSTANDVVQTAQIFLNFINND
jgi:hypothetical protein